MNEAMTRSCHNEPHSHGGRDVSYDANVHSNVVAYELEHTQSSFEEAEVGCTFDNESVLHRHKLADGRRIVSNMYCDQKQDNRHSSE